jgi:hypothetical protein
MKRLICILFLLLCINSNILAQDKKEKIEALKIAFITKALSLSSEEAQKFWPIYNEYELKKLDSRKKYMQPARIALSNPSNLTDKEIDGYVNSILTHKSNEVEFQKELYKKLKTVISLKKIAALITAESNYKIELIKKIRDKKGLEEE